LGGAEARTSVQETRNYFVLMTTPDRDEDAGAGGGPGGGSGGGPGWGGGGGVTRGLELAIDAVVAERSIAEQVTCETKNTFSKALCVCVCVGFAIKTFGVWPMEIAKSSFLVPASLLNS
jgi:hypothetical protein